MKKSLKHLALMRGINVGGKNMLPMKDLAKIFTAAGCGNVQTFIQSGNVIFDATPQLAIKLPGLISAQVAKRFGFQIPVVVRTHDQLQEIFAGNPFLKAGADADLLHVMFLADLPDPGAVASLDPQRSPPDEFIVQGREIFLRLPDGVAGRQRRGSDCKLTNSYFDSKLATVSTSRNWRTVTKLLEMMVG